MLIIPAIDLKEGKVVRLRQGRYDKKVYSSDPLKTAKHWQRQGAELIHMVDLDGAMSGRISDFEILKKIVKEVSVPTEFGGGIRDKATIKKLLDLGFKRVVIGTKAVEDEKFLRDVFRQFKDKIIISIDVMAHSVFSRGWLSENKRIDPLTLGNKLKQIGFKQIIHTDIARDGTLKGPNILGLKQMLKLGLEVIASGGISSLVDILKLKSLEIQGLIGVIIGKALYEARFTLRQAIEAGIRKGGEINDRKT